MNIFESITLHEAVMIFRRRKGLSIREAAKRADVTKALWADFERGHYEWLRLSQLIRMCAVLGYELSISLHPNEGEERGE